MSNLCPDALLPQMESAELPASIPVLDALALQFWRGRQLDLGTSVLCDRYQEVQHLLNLLVGVLAALIEPFLSGDSTMVISSCEWVELTPRHGLW